MIPWLSLFTATAWVDFVTIALSKVLPLTKALDRWYADFGIVAAISDVSIITLGIVLVKLLVPTAAGWTLVGLSVAVQIIHDVLFYIVVILGVPTGQNAIIDLLKKYAAEGGWKPIVADSLMIGSSVLLMEWFEQNLSFNWIAFLGILAVYSITYILYTK